MSDFLREWGVLLIGIGVFAVIFAMAHIQYYFDHREDRRDHD